MAKRHTELSTDYVMNFRINLQMKTFIDNQADLAGISSAEWMRRALQEKIDSITGAQKNTISDDELDARIEKALRKMMIERDEKRLSE